MAPTISDVYDALSEKLGKTEAKIVTDYLEEISLRNGSKIDKAVDQKLLHLVTREDLGDTKLELTRIINDVKEDISNVRVDLIKWMAGIFVALVIMILGLYATIIFK